MAPHIMLSYQWDDQALVRRIFGRLRDDGLPVWMDVEGGVTGDVNDAMAAGVEGAAVIVPVMTPAYQASRSCKKELSYADARQVAVVPVLLAPDWEASEWLGLITAGLLWVDFRRAEEDEESFDACVRALEEEIGFNAGHLLAAEREEEQEEQEEQPRPKKKPGRGFRHTATELYIQDSGEQRADAAGGAGAAGELGPAPGDGGRWEEIKGDGCKFYRNALTGRYLGFDPARDRVRFQPGPAACEEWLLLVDRTDRGHRRAVVIKNKRSGRFLAVRGGRVVGLASCDEDCKWFLE